MKTAPKTARFPRRVIHDVRQTVGYIELIFATWWALKMTFGIIPGACLVAFTFECGSENKPFRLSGFFKFWKDAEQAKREGLKETAKLFFPIHPAFGLVIISGILFIIFGDSLMLVVVNLASIPISLFSYYQGVKLRNKNLSLSVERDDSEFDEKMIALFKAVTPYAIRIILLWFLLSGLIMTGAYFVGIWKPH